MMAKNLKKDLASVRSHVINTRADFFRAEEVAKILKINVRRVEHCFHFLNLEGLLSQTRHVRCHDAEYRDAGFDKFIVVAGRKYSVRKMIKKSKCWHPDVYYKVTK